ASDSAAGTSQQGSTPWSAPALPLRKGDTPMAELIGLYMSHYAGRDTARVQRLAWWKERVGTIALQDLSDDHVHAELEALSSCTARYYAGKDADGRPIFKSKKKPMAPATINRYGAAL